MTRERTVAQISWRGTQSNAAGFNDGKSAWQLTQHIRQLKKRLNEPNDDIRSRSAGQLDDHKPRILIRWVVANVRKIIVSSQQAESVSLCVGSNDIVGCGAHSQISYIDRVMAVISDGLTRGPRQ